MLPAKGQSMLRNFKFEPHELASEELQHVYRGRDSALAVNMFSGAIAAILLALNLGVWAAVGWLTWLLAASLWHWSLGRPGGLAVGAALPLEIKYHIAAAALAGLGWGILAAAMPWLDTSVQAALLVMMLVSVITAMPRLVVYLPLFVAFAGGVFAPLLLVTAFLDDAARQMVGLGLTIAVVSLSLTAREVRAILVDILRKQISYERVSWEDRLTGLGNRRHFDDQFDTAWRQAARMRVPLSLIILDVDHFKKFNDNYGHQAGDECLRRVATALSGCVKRAGDSVARYGGEEFAVVLFHTPMTEARSMGERLRKAVMDLGLEHAHSSGGVVTISVGGATTVPSADGSAEGLIKQADEALYRAKGSGRNRVEWNMTTQQS